MTPQQLRNSILQMAIEGKLTEQRAEDGNAADLLKEIQAEKAKLIAEKKIKKEKPLPEISEDEVPFEIPENWVWCRLYDLGACSDNAFADGPFGSNLKAEHYTTVPEVRIIQLSNIGEDGWKDKNVKYTSFSHAETIKRSMVEAGNIVIAKMMPAGRAIEVPVQEKGYILSSDAVKFVPHHKLYKTYLLYAINSNIFRAQIYMEVQGITRVRTSLTKLKKYLIPLPPLAEQQRIVARLEEILPQVDAYEKAYNELQELNKQFPGNLKNSLLQMAVEGKLVEQRAEEGNAADLLKEIQAEKAKLIAEKKIKKEKPLPEITEDEVPFEIPDNWIWAYVGDLFMHNTGKAMNSSAKKVNKTGTIRKFITTSNVYWNKFELTNLKEMFFSDDELERCTITSGDILICEGGAYYGRTAIWDKEYDICFQNHVHRLRKYKTLINLFFYYIFYFYRNNGLMQSKGTAMPGLSSVVLHNTIVPLPPLAEQKRIVAKLEQLLPLCDALQEY